MTKLEIWSDAHNINSIGLHIVWCTKFRHSVLKDGVDVFVKNIIAQTCGDNDWAVRSMEVMPDHIHLFVQIHPTDCPVDVVRILKSVSAVAVFTKFPKLKGEKFWGSGLWSKGAYYGSVGQVSQETVERYIEEQKKKD